MVNQVTTNSDMKVYNDLAQTAYLERIQDRLDVFNQSSKGAIILDSEMIEGDMRKSAGYTIGGEIADRDVNSTAVAETKKIGSVETISIKKPWKYGPYASTEEAFKRRARTPEEFYNLMGQDSGDAFLSGAIKAAATSLEAAIGTNSAMVVSADWATDGKKVLTKGMRKFGDRSERIVVFAMNSETYFDMIDGAIDAKVYEEAGVVIYGGNPGTMGKPVIVSDQFSTGKILGLQGGAARITESQGTTFRAWPDNESENFAMKYKGEGTFNIELLGYSWKSADDVNPTFANLGTGSKWKKVATSDKATAGVCINVTTGEVAPAPTAP